MSCPGTGLAIASSSDLTPCHSLDWPHAAVAADLIDTPVNFQRMIVRVAKLHGDLTAGAAAAFKVDLGAAFTQAIARVQDFAERRHLESEVM